MADAHSDSVFDFRDHLTPELIEQVLNEAVRTLFERTGHRYHVHIEFEADGYILRCQRDDGYHCALHTKKPAALGPALETAYGRTDTVAAENCARIWLTLSVPRDVEAVVRGHKAQQAGIDPQDWWKNDPGTLVAIIANGTVEVRDWATQGGYCSPNHLAFYVGDSCVYRVSKKLVGAEPSDEILNAAWDVYQDGLAAGERLGVKAGRKALKRELAALLSEEA